MSLTIGELCAGYGGLGMAVEEVFGARLAWVSEYEAAPSKILAHHWPHVPNLGDMTRIDWAAVEPVDIISGGTPCQDLSSAGKRAGMTAGTRSNLWAEMREAVATIRPRFVVWENVEGALNASANSQVEPCAGCVGDGSDVSLRALGRVLGDLAELGYDATWTTNCASDAGAPHHRKRVFLLAYPEGIGGGKGHSHGNPGTPQSGSAGAWHPARTLGDVLLRWGGIVGRPHPHPLRDEPFKGNAASPAFWEWLMGLPEHHVTAVPGLTQAEQIKALGNGVVPQQAAAALRHILFAITETEAA